MATRRAGEKPFAGAWALLLAGALVFVGWESWVGAERIRARSAEGFAFVAPEARDPASLTGNAHGERFVIMPERLDELHWIAHAQIMESGGALRLRHVNYDNAPEGRPAHWSAPYGWWIRALARIDSWASGRALPLAIESAALYANAVLAALAMAGLAFAAARRFGALAASAVILGFVGIMPFRDVFVFSSGDHHAAATLSAVTLVFGLAVAASRIDASGRAWWIISGAAGGLGLWVSAVSLAPVIAAAHAGAFAIVWLERRNWDADETKRFASRWRLWAASGAATSLAAYLIEYAPSDFSMRLEVNHPFYAMAWLGGSEVLRGFARCLAGDRKRGSIQAIAGGVLILPLPLSVFVAGDAVYRVADPFLWALHERYIVEFQSMAAYLSAQPSWLRSAALCVPFALLLTGALAFRWTRSADRRLPLALALGPAAILSALALFQVRWWGEAGGLLAGLAAAACFAADGAPAPRARWLKIAIVAMLAPGCIWNVAATFREPPLIKQAANRIAERGVAHFLRERAPEDDVVVLASPDATSAFMYHGGLRGIGTFYWENAEGLRRAAQMFGAATDEEARRLLEEAGVTHVVVLSWGGFERQYLSLNYEFFPGAAPPEDTFLMRLVRDGTTPNWLRQIPFTLMNHPLLDGEVALIFEVTEPLDPRRAQSERLEFFLQMGWIEGARPIVSDLEQLDDYLPALVSLARYDALAKRFDRFEERAARIRELLAQAEGMAAGERARMSAILLAARHEAEAREQFRIAMSELDERELRRLTTDSVRQFLELSRRLDAPWPDAALETLAETLSAAYRAPFAAAR